MSNVTAENCPAVPAGWHCATSQRFERASGAIGLCAIAVWLISAMAVGGGDEGDVMSRAVSRATASATGAPLHSLLARETAIGGYGGMTDTLNSIVSIVKPGQIDMTVKDFAWKGRPFEAPIYYGVRVLRWHSLTVFGSMVDFTHAKAIALATSDATFTGTRDGKPVPPKSKVEGTFRHLEFSHGHNMLTWNGLFRWPALVGRIRPYVGGGAGISLPHTEIGFRDKNARTYEYQFAGFVGQVLGGVEIDLGRASVFFEYKFSYAPYDVPLSEEPRGHLLFTDLWRQFGAWMGGVEPSGGRLTTTLATHHGIGGIMVRVGAAPPAASQR